jgi:HYR domain
MKILASLSFIIILLLSAPTSHAQTCMLTCPANIVIKTDSSKEGAIVNYPPATVAGECGVITYSPASGSFFRIGSHSVTVTSASGQKCSFTITITDNESPVLSVVTLSAKKIWPPSGKLKKVAVYYTASDNAEEVNSVLTVKSNDTQSTTRDWEVVNNHLLRLKAARLPNGEPRVYTITVTSSDVAGNTTRRTTSIVVAKTILVQDIVMK